MIFVTSAITDSGRKSSTGWKISLKKEQQTAILAILSQFHAHMKVKFLRLAMSKYCQISGVLLGGVKILSNIRYFAGLGKKIVKYQVCF